MVFRELSGEVNFGLLGEGMGLVIAAWLVEV